MNMSLAFPYFLVLLLLLPCFIWCRVKAKVLYFSKPEWLPKQTWTIDKSLWWIIIIYTLLVLALSSPFIYDSLPNAQKKGRDLVLILDTSGSMGERGFDRENRALSRYDISVNLAKDFMQKRYDDNMGLVIFGTFAFTASPLTYDAKALSEMFGLMSDVGIAGTSTAIGDALVQGVQTLKAGEAKSKVLILLTDGQHNAGEHSPRQAVAMAKKQGIKIYTIGIGKKGAYDEVLLDTISKESGGKSFFATNAEALKKVYKSIEKLEPSPIRSQEYWNKKPLFLYPLAIATLMLFLLILGNEEQR